MVKINYDFRYINQQDIFNIGKCIDGINKQTSLKLRQYFKGKNYKVLLVKKRIEVTNENNIVIVSLFFEG